MKINEKKLLTTSYAISDDCSRSIELLLDIESNLESIGKNMYAHCKIENATTKNQYSATINEQVAEMKDYFELYKKKNLTDIKLIMKLFSLLLPTLNQISENWKVL